jgi:dolichol-phosphate mannosyltransferase
VPRSRRFWSFSASIVFRVLFPTPGVRDYTCGYRAYRVEALRAAVERYGLQFVDQDGFQCMVDILLKLRRLDLVFGEVPIILRYDQKEGGTKMRVGETARNTLRLAFRTRLSG